METKKAIASLVVVVFVFSFMYSRIRRLTAPNSHPASTYQSDGYISFNQMILDDCSKPNPDPYFMVYDHNNNLIREFKTCQSFNRLFKAIYN